MATETPAILYEHADGRRAVVSANRVATFAIDNPDWHRAGPVEIVWVDDPIRWPKNAKEVREFFNSDFISAQFAAPDQSPCDDDRYYISAHDFLSAINWWADLLSDTGQTSEPLAGSFQEKHMCNCEWQSIETAPRDGRTLFLGKFNSHGKWRTMRGQWMSENYIAEHWEDPDGVEPGWFETAVEPDDPPNCWPINPTHWMKLPESPYGKN